MRIRKDPEPSGLFIWSLLTFFMFLLGVGGLVIASKALGLVLFSHPSRARMAWGVVAFMGYGALIGFRFAYVRIKGRLSRMTKTGGRMPLGIPVHPDRFTAALWGPIGVVVVAVTMWGFMSDPRSRLAVLFGGAIWIAMGLAISAMSWIGHGRTYLLLGPDGLVVSDLFLRYRIPLPEIEGVYINDEVIFFRLRNLDALRGTVSSGRGEPSEQALARFDGMTRHKLERRGFPIWVDTLSTFGIDPYVLKQTLESLIADSR